MDGPAVLARFDAETRADPPPEAGVRREWAGPVLRTLGDYNLIGWWTFAEADTDAVVAAETTFFTRLGQEVEWKLYSHDWPANLEAALAAAGWTGEPPETFLALDLAEADLGPPPPGIDVRQVTDPAGVVDLVAANEAAFDRVEGWRLDALMKRLGDDSLALYVAYADGEPISSGRLEMIPGSAFAGLYGGGTRPEHRGRGVYRALVAARAAEAVRRGFRYLTVDALETSRPILQRLGFSALSTICGWTLGG